MQVLGLGYLELGSQELRAKDIVSSCQTLLVDSLWVLPRAFQDSVLVSYYCLSHWKTLVKGTVVNQLLVIRGYYKFPLKMSSLKGSFEDSFCS